MTEEQQDLEIIKDGIYIQIERVIDASWYHCNSQEKKRLYKTALKALHEAKDAITELMIKD